VLTTLALSQRNTKYKKILEARNKILASFPFFMIKKTLLAILLFVSNINFSIADIESGKKVFNKCTSCHSIKQEKNKLGPHLVKIFGRKAGSIENFKYSSALKDSGIIWSEETLKGYLANPRKYIPGTKMSFAGIKNTDQLNHLIEYLKKDSN